MDPNSYRIEKDKEWVQRWEAREEEFRKLIAESRKEYDIRMESSKNYIKKIDKTLHEQQAIILKIRSIPIVGPLLLKWANYRY